MSDGEDFDEQLRLAIENSLKDSHAELYNEFESQDSAFFSDITLDISKKPSTEKIVTNNNGKPGHSVEEKGNKLVDKKAPSASSTAANTGSIFNRLTNLVAPLSSSAVPRPRMTESTAATVDTRGVRLCKACQGSLFSSMAVITTDTGDAFHSACFVCGGCHNPINGQYLTHTSSQYPYHKDCFRCAGCNEVIRGQFADHGDPPQPYHPQCGKELFAPRCCLCAHTLDGRFYRHPFFESEIYCMSHESVPSCFACSRKEPLPRSHREGFVDLMDGRSLCVQCSSSIIVDSSEAHALYLGIVEFMGRELGLPIPPEMRDVPILVVDVHSLNENMNRKEGSLGYHDAGEAGGKNTVRGVTLSTCCEVRHFAGGSLQQLAGAVRAGSASSLFQIKEVRDVTAVLVLYGLPRDLTASILAHEAMHVWLKLNKDFPFRMQPKLEEGLCQVISFLYLESVNAKTYLDAPTTSEAALKHLAQEEALRTYFCKQIREDLSPVYGDGFREAHEVVSTLGLEVALEYIQHHKSLPPV